MNISKRSFLEPVWSFFCSLKLTLFLLILLALISIIGTVLPQGDLPPEYTARISNAKFEFYSALGFFDMYHSRWFKAILSLLSLNLICCSIRRLPHVLRYFTHPQTVFESSQANSHPFRHEISFSGSQEDVSQRLAGFLNNEFAAAVVTEQGGEYHLFAQKAPWCRLAVYLVHASILVIFGGAIIGSINGYKGYVSIVEGQSVSKMVSSSQQQIDLGFELRCDQFTVKTYSNGAPKEFKSILTVLENGRPVPGYTNARVVVNDPLTYKGITFYQSSYGNAGSYFFNVADAGGKQAASLVANGRTPLQLPDGSRLQVVEATDDISAFDPALSGPAVQVVITSPTGEREELVIYGRHPELNIRHAKAHGAPFVIHYQGGQERFFTGLQVSRDPGVPVVWIGCLMMVVGLMAAFFMSHQRIWIVVSGGQAVMYGNASKNPAAFASRFEGLSEKLTALQV